MEACHIVRSLPAERHNFKLHRAENQVVADLIGHNADTSSKGLLQLLHAEVGDANVLNFALRKTRACG